MTRGSFSRSDRLPLLPLNVPLTERQRFQSSKLARWVRLPQGTLSIRVNIPGSSLLVVMPGFEPGVRRFDSYLRSLQKEVIRLDEEPVLKTGGGTIRL